VLFESLPPRQNK